MMNERLLKSRENMGEFANSTEDEREIGGGRERLRER